MQDNNLSRKILEKINNEKIRPKARWRFALINVLVWFSGVIVMLLAAMAFSVMIHVFIYNDWDAYGYFAQGFVKFVFLIMPYFWLICLALFSLLFFIFFRKTKKGYKFAFYQIFLFSIAASVILGMAFYNAGVGQAIDEKLSREAPIYRKVLNHRLERWNSPVEGRLFGKIKQVDSDDLFFLADISGRDWRVFYKEAEVMHKVNIKPGIDVRVMGEIVDNNEFNNVFYAIRILPERPFGGRIGPMHDMKKYFFPSEFEGACCGGREK